MAFNESNAEKLASLYAADAINHQVLNENVIGRTAIKQMFIKEFSKTSMTCIPENIFTDRDWIILE